MGIDIKKVMESARNAEELCSSDDLDNPASNLAAFLFDNYKNGRDKFSFFTPKRGRVLGLWIEQLVAESLGKNGFGILPNIEVDSLVLREDPHDRTVITYNTKTDLWDDRQNFSHALEFIDPAIPRMSFKVLNVEEVAAHFVMWEYAIAMVGYLMKVCPFDQPDVAVAKKEVLSILANAPATPNSWKRVLPAFLSATLRCTCPKLFANPFQTNRSFPHCALCSAALSPAITSA